MNYSIRPYSRFVRAPALELEHLEDLKCSVHGILVLFLLSNNLHADFAGRARVAAATVGLAGADFRGSLYDASHPVSYGPWESKDHKFN